MNVFYFQIIYDSENYEKEKIIIIGVKINLIKNKLL